MLNKLRIYSAILNQLYRRDWSTHGKESMAEFEQLLQDYNLVATTNENSVLVTSQ